MLPFLLIALTYQIIVTDCFLDDCSIDQWQLVDSVPIADTLEAFYKGLKFVEACTEFNQSRQYEAIYDNICTLATDPDSKTIDMNYVPAYVLFSEVVDYLEGDQFREATTRLNHDDDGSFASDWIVSYFYFLKAEIKRLTGEIDEATQALLAAFLERKNSRGVSMNHLERLDGLLMLQKVSQFNQAIDKFYGVKESPGHQLLELVDLLFKDETAPLDELSTLISDRLFRTKPTISSSGIPISYGVRRASADLDDFSGHSVSIALVKSILCEFAHKLAALGVSSADEQRSMPDYSSVMDQLRRLDTDFATELERRVVRHIDTDLDTAAHSARHMWLDMINNPYFDHDHARLIFIDNDYVRSIFVGYFNMELYHRRSGCNLQKLHSLHKDLVALKGLRQEHEGVSLGKMAELEARLVLHWLRCFQERLKLAYELDGDENEQQLQAKRSELGASIERILPDSSPIPSDVTPPRIMSNQ